MKLRCKSLILILTVLLAGLFLTACQGNKNNQQEYVLPDLSGKTISNYKNSIDSSFITIVEKKENSDTIPLDQFIRYGGSLSAGDKVNAGNMVYVYFSSGPAKIADTEKPQIIGADDVEVEYSSTFDPYAGVTVTDNVDKDLTSRLIVTGTVNTLIFKDQTITYTVMDRSGNTAEVVRKITIVPATLDTRYTDSLKLTTPYEGKNFLTDGIGVATVAKCIDGDTVHFYVAGQSTPIAVRFLGIDTAESTALYEPWGKAASKYTCDKVTNAHTIVLERENEVFDSTGTRYLAWVWVDGRLLNLELVEEAYTPATGAADSKYSQIFSEADTKTQGTKRRIWGEKDPDYDYSLEGVQISLEELRTHQADYLGKKVTIRGTVTSKIGANVYIEQDGYGVYIFVWNTYTTKLEPGNYVILSGVVPTDYNNLLEISNFRSEKTTVVSTGNQFTPTLLTPGDIAERYEGTYVQMNNLEITSVETPDEKGSYTITAKDETGHEIYIRHDGGIYPHIDSSLFIVGHKIDVVGPIGQFYDDYQLMISNISDITFH